MMNQLKQIRRLMELAGHEWPAAKWSLVVRAFHLYPGGYAEHDRFLCSEYDRYFIVYWGDLHKIAAQFANLRIDKIQQLLESPFNEERMVALFILIIQYKKASSSRRNQLYQFYLDNLRYVNNWNLVDWSAHLIIGAHLLEKDDKTILIQLANSKSMWERRVAMVATWYFIEHNQVEWTFKIAELLFNDKQKLVQKSVRWMIREAGKRNQTALTNFLDQYLDRLPRFMLSYAVARLPEALKTSYLRKHSSLLKKVKH